MVQYLCEEQEGQGIQPLREVSCVPPTTTYTTPPTCVPLGSPHLQGSLCS